MHSIIRNITLAILVCSFAACEKEDRAVAPSGGTFSQVDLGNNYNYQAYFDLSSGEEKAFNSKFEWDLAFSSDPNIDAVYLNAARLMKVFRTETQNFDSSFTFSYDYDWRYDDPTGDPKKTAFGNWKNPDGSSKMMVYLVDLGINENGDTLGYRKMQVLSSNGQSYTIKFAGLKGGNEEIFQVSRDAAYKENCISIMDVKQLDIQPVKTEWDFHFTSYTDGLWDGTDTIAYIVTGVLINTFGSMVAFDDSLNYNSISIDDVPYLDISADANAIGYDWKYFNFDNQVYEIVEGVNYVIRDIDGIHYKLRFVGWYNAQGEKGSPQFEYEKL